jgi:hypothetical protein
LLGHVSGGALGAADLILTLTARERDGDVFGPVAEPFDRFGLTKAIVSEV